MSKDPKNKSKHGKVLEFKTVYKDDEESRGIFYSSSDILELGKLGKPMIPPQSLMTSRDSEEEVKDSPFSSSPGSLLSGKVFPNAKNSKLSTYGKTFPDKGNLPGEEERFAPMETTLPSKKRPVENDMDCDMDFTDSVPECSPKGMEGPKDPLTAAFNEEELYDSLEEVVEFSNVPLDSLFILPILFSIDNLRRISKPTFMAKTVFVDKIPSDLTWEQLPFFFDSLFSSINARLPDPIKIKLNLPKDVLEDHMQSFIYHKATIMEGTMRKPNAQIASFLTSAYIPILPVLISQIGLVEDKDGQVSTGKLSWPWAFNASTVRVMQTRKEFTSNHLVTFISNEISSNQLTATPEVAIIRGLPRDGPIISMVLANIQKKYGEFLAKVGLSKNDGVNLAQNLRMAPVEVKVLALGVPHSSVVGNAIASQRISRERGLRATSLFIKVYAGKASLHQHIQRIFKECFGMSDTQGTIVGIAGVYVEFDPSMEYACSFPLPASITMQMERRPPAALKFSGLIENCLTEIVSNAGKKGTEVGQILGLALRMGIFYENKGSNVSFIFAKERIYGMDFFGCHKSLSQAGNDFPEDHAASQENWAKLMIAYMEFVAFPQQRLIPKLNDFLSLPFPFGSHGKGQFTRTVNVRGYAATFHPVSDQHEYASKKPSTSRSFSNVVSGIDRVNTSDQNHTASPTPKYDPQSYAITSLKQENTTLKLQMEALKTSLSDKMDAIMNAYEEQKSVNALLQQRLAQFTDIEMDPSAGDDEL